MEVQSVQMWLDSAYSEAVHFARRHSGGKITPLTHHLWHLVAAMERCIDSIEVEQPLGREPFPAPELLDPLRPCPSAPGSAENV